MPTLALSWRCMAVGRFGLTMPASLSNKPQPTPLNMYHSSVPSAYQTSRKLRKVFVETQGH